MVAAFTDQSDPECNRGCVRRWVIGCSIHPAIHPSLRIVLACGSADPGGEKPMCTNVGRLRGFPPGRGGGPRRVWVAMGVYQHNSAAGRERLVEAVPVAGQPASRDDSRCRDTPVCRFVKRFGDMGTVEHKTGGTLVSKCCQFPSITDAD